MNVITAHLSKLNELDPVEACITAASWMNNYMHTISKTPRIVEIINDVEKSNNIKNYFYINTELFEFCEEIKKELREDECFDEFMKSKEKPEHLKMMVKIWNECMDYLLMFEEVYQIEHVQKSFATYGMVPAAKIMIKLYILYGNLYVYNFTRLYIR